jgi:hypothetical protein
MDKSEADVVVCHCIESHRFVVSPKELVTTARRAVTMRV